MSQLSDSETPTEPHATNLNTNNIISGAQGNASLAQIQQGVGRSTKSQAMKIQSKRVISVGVKPSSVVPLANNSNQNSSKNGNPHAANLDDANNVKKGSDSDTTNTKSNTNNEGDKYRALLDNVSVHLESSLKQQDESASNTNTTTESPSHAGVGNAGKVPGLRTKGGALKKVNKRYVTLFLYFWLKKTLYSVLWLVRNIAFFVIPLYSSLLSLYYIYVVLFIFPKIDGIPWMDFITRTLPPTTAKTKESPNSPPIGINLGSMAATGLMVQTSHRHMHSWEVCQVLYYVFFCVVYGASFVELRVCSLFGISCNSSVYSSSYCITFCFFFLSLSQDKVSADTVYSPITTTTMLGTSITPPRTTNLWARATATAPMHAIKSANHGPSCR